jgi:hypothetical protein
METVERSEEAFAGNAESGVDALGDERLDQDVAGGDGSVRRTAVMRGAREAGGGATRVCLRRRGSVAARA